MTWPGSGNGNPDGSHGAPDALGGDVHGSRTAAGTEGPAGGGSRRSGNPDGSHGIADAMGGRASGSRPVAATVPAVGGGSDDAAGMAGVSRSPAVVAGNGSGSSDRDAMLSRRVIRWVTTAAVIVVAACAARSSYEHQRTVVEMAGDPEAAWYLPLSVDGMMLIASLNMLVRRWDGQRAGWLTWTALLLGGAASLAANIAAAEPTWTGRLVSAWSPICLIVSYELLMQQLPNREAPTAGDEPGR